MSTNSRKKNLVHWPIQGTLVRRLILQWFAFIVATCAVTLLLQFLMNPLQPSAERGNQLRLTIGSFLAVSLCLIPIFILDSIKLSNRFVGPIVRLQSFVQQVGRGEVTQFQLRSGDFWQSLSQDVNEMVDRLTGRTTLNRNKEPSEANVG